MNQFEFKKLIAKLEKLPFKGWYAYGMKLYVVYPCRWKAVLVMHDLLNKQYSECEDLKSDVRCN